MLMALGRWVVRQLGASNFRRDWNYGKNLLTRESSLALECVTILSHLSRAFSECVSQSKASSFRDKVERARYWKMKFHEFKVLTKMKRSSTTGKLSALLMHFFRLKQTRGERRRIPY
jgi:hypothetical protein